MKSVLIIERLEDEALARALGQSIEQDADRIWWVYEPPSAGWWVVEDLLGGGPEPSR